jgi:predicted dinucleotide-binding enzyme
MKKIGVLGSGAVAQTLAAGAKKHGYDVMIGSRSPAKLAEWAGKAGVPTGTFAEVAAWGDALILAVKGTAAVEACELAGAANLAGKLVMDATNPIKEAPPTDGVLSFFTTFDQSLMEVLQARFATAKFVKAFSCVGNALMVNPTLRGGTPSMFICGNDAGAKADTTALLTKFGWETEDMGTAAAARAIEPLCILWCIPGFRQNDWVHAYKVLRPA